MSIEMSRKYAHEMPVGEEGQVTTICLVPNLISAVPLGSVNGTDGNLLVEVGVIPNRGIKCPFSSGNCDNCVRPENSMANAGKIVVPESEFTGKPFFLKKPVSHYPRSEEGAKVEGYSNLPGLNPALSYRV